MKTVRYENTYTCDECGDKKELPMAGSFRGDMNVVAGFDSRMEDWAEIALPVSRVSVHLCPNCWVRLAAVLPTLLKKAIALALVPRGSTSTAIAIGRNSK